MPWDASRVVMRGRRRGSRGARSRVGRRWRGRPAAVLARRVAARVRLRRRRLAELWVAESGKRGRRRERAPGAGGAQAARGAGVGPGTTFVRVVARQARELAWCRNEDGFGRLVISARASDRRASCQGLAPRASTGGGRDRVRAFRCGDAAADRGARRERVGPGARSRGGPVGGFEATGLVEPRRGHVEVGSATVHGLLWRAPAGELWRAAARRSGPAARARARRPDRSGAGRLGDAACRRSCSAAGRVLQPDYRGSTGYGARDAQALGGRVGRPRRRRCRGRDPRTRRRKAGPTPPTSRSWAGARAG